MKQLKQVLFDWGFLILTVLVYVFLFFSNSELFFSSFSFFSKILLNLIPVFVFVFVLMSLVNFFVSKKTVLSFISSSHKRKWIFSALAGILSTGPIFMWYPFLQQLKEKGFNEGLIAVFLYNRAIKIPLIPLAVFYFGLKFVLILAFVMVLFSIVQGVLLNRLMKLRIAFLEG